MSRHCFGFSFDTGTNIYTKLYDFTLTTGGNPTRSLLQGRSGLLFGTAQRGGVYGYGTVFSYNILTNTYTDLFDFDNNNGASPQSDVVEVMPGIAESIDNKPDHQPAISLYPNPLTDKLYVNVKDDVTSEIIIYDMLSKKLMQQTFTNSMVMNMNELAPGIYIYEVRNGNGVLGKGKIVKE